MSSQRDDRVFLVRMWREDDPNGHGTWRGSVQDVVAGRRLYFSSPTEIADFINVALRDANDD